MLYVGIDWATRSHTATLMTGPGKAIATMTVENTLEGFLKLLDAIRKQTGQNRPATLPEDVSFAIEDRNQRLVDFLLSYGFTGYYIEPNRMKGYRLRYRSSGNKTDITDAFILADVLCRDRDQLPHCTPPSDDVRALKALLLDREGFVRNQTRLINRLTACLRQYYPEALELFADITGKAALAFIGAYPDFAAARKLDRQEVQEFLAAHHCNRTRQLERIVGLLAREPIPVPAIIVAAKRRQALHLIRELQTVQQTVADYDAEIDRLGRENEEVQRFRSLPGSGPLISAGLYAMFGDDRTRFTSVMAVQSYAGTAPKTQQSGNWRGVNFRFVCNRFCRMMAGQLAFCSLKSSSWAKQYYLTKRAEGKSNQHAKRCLANLLLKIAFAIWRDRTSYNETHHLAQITLHNMRKKAKQAKTV